MGMQKINNNTIQPAINDLSFQYKFYSKDNANKILHQFIEVCKKIESDQTHGLNKIVGVRIDTTFEIVEGIKLIKLLQEFETKEEQSYLLGL